MPTDLPSICDSNDLVRQLGQPPKDIIKGVLGQGSKGVLGGATKTNKTWMLADLALSVAYELPWMGMETVQGRVMLLNLELQDYFYSWRLREIARKRRIPLEPDRFFVWNLRGHSESYSTFLDKITSRLLERQYSLTELDPIYKILGEAVENDATDVTKMLNYLEKFSIQTRSAVFFAAHFPKGNAALKESIDRISGSGVFARDPDTIITVTRHKEPGCYTIDFTLRNHAPIQSFVVRWEYPLMVRADDLDPSDLKEPSPGRPKICEASALLAILPRHGLSFSEWLEAAGIRLNVRKTAFSARLKELELTGLVRKEGKIWLPAENNESSVKSSNGQNHT